MFGPGAYVLDPTEGIVALDDLPMPIIVPDDRNVDHRPCLRGGNLSYRYKSDQRTLHDLGDLLRLFAIGGLRLVQDQVLFEG